MVTVADCDLRGLYIHGSSPRIDGNNPDSARGGVGTINGTGFGTKPLTTPYYEDFQGVTLGNQTGTVAGMVISGSGGTSCIDTDSNSGSKCLSHLFTAVDFPKIYKSLSGTEERFYSSCAFKTTGSTNATPTAVWKFGRIGSNVEYSGLPHAGESWTSSGISSTPTGTGMEVVNSNGIVASSVDNTATASISAEFTTNTWHFYEFEFYAGTVNNSDAVIVVRYNNVELLNWTNVPYLTTASPLLPEWYLTPFNGLDGLHPITLLMDDLYMDESRCRVIMTDNASYASSTKWATQPITSWSDTSIGYTAKRQSFAVDDTAYLHAFDDDGSLVYSGSSITVIEDL